MIPGEIISKNKKIILNADKETATIMVANIGDRPIQVGSHFHFFEANKSLKFNRQIAFGMHLDIASGTAVRFEPGEEKEVQLVSIGGTMEIYGFNGLVSGKVTDPSIKEAALASAKEKGFII